MLPEAGSAECSVGQVLPVAGLFWEVLLEDTKIKIPDWAEPLLVAPAMWVCWAGNTAVWTEECEVGQPRGKCLPRAGWGMAGGAGTPGVGDSSSSAQRGWLCPQCHPVAQQNPIKNQTTKPLHTTAHELHRNAYQTWIWIKTPSSK